MKHSMDRGAASALMFSSVFTRLFWGMAADAPVVHVAAWLCPLVGLILFLPIAWISHRRFRSGDQCPWQLLEKSCPKPILKAASILIAVCFLLDCASGMRTLAGTANLISMDKIPLFYLLLPLGIFAAISILLGIGASGNCARIWNRLLPLLTVFVLLVHLRSYNPAWLTPVFGSGESAIFKSGIYCASAILLLSMQWLLTGTKGRGRPFLAALIAVLAAALQLATLQMLSPALTGVDLSRSSRMQLVLSNGRTAMPLQILLMLLCYGGFLQLISAEAAACAGFLSRAMPKLPVWTLAAAVAVLTVIFSSLPYRIIDRYTGIFTCFFPLIARIKITAATAMKLPIHDGLAVNLRARRVQFTNALRSIHSAGESPQGESKYHERNLRTSQLGILTLLCSSE